MHIMHYPPCNHLYFLIQLLMYIMFFASYIIHIIFCKSLFKMERDHCRWDDKDDGDALWLLIKNHQLLCTQKPNTSSKYKTNMEFYLFEMYLHCALLFVLFFASLLYICVSSLAIQYVSKFIYYWFETVQYISWMSSHILMCECIPLVDCFEQLQ